MHQETSTCLYCGEPTPRPMAFHACCYRLYSVCICREQSSYWRLLEVLADRDETGIADTFSILDEWERLGIVERVEQKPKYRRLSERGKQLYQYLRDKRQRKFAGAA